MAAGTSPAILRVFTTLLTTTASLRAVADWETNLPRPVAPITQDIFDLHMMTATIATVIMVIVTAMIIYALVKFRKSRGYEADQQFHRNWFGRWSWALVPVIVLGIDFSVAGPATRTLRLIESHPDVDLTVKVVGSQWKWTYEYMDGDDEPANDVRIVSNLVRDLTPEDEHYLRDVDSPLVLPVDRKIRFLHTSTDVLHAWWVPALVYKKDAIPGYINETWTEIKEEGVYRGQCAENCGTGHAYMPIVVKAVQGEEFDSWFAEQQSVRLAKAQAAGVDRERSLEELMQQGQEVYTKNCAACHQPGGEGLAPAFPALKGGQIATGDIRAHLDIVIHGSKKNPVMIAWGNQLNDLEVAAVVTYERNAFGNDTGDVVQTADVKAARQTLAKAPE